MINKHIASELKSQNGKVVTYKDLIKYKNGAVIYWPDWLKYPDN